MKGAVAVGHGARNLSSTIGSTYSQESEREASWLEDLSAPVKMRLKYFGGGRRVDEGSGSSGRRHSGSGTAST